MKQNRIKIFHIALLIIAICNSCKKTDAPQLNTSNYQDPEILGSWSLHQIVNIVTNKNGKLSIDSIKAIKGYTDDLSFNEKGFKLRDKIINYKIVKLKNETYLTYAPYEAVITLKLTKKNDVSFILESSDSTSTPQRITKYYFQKD